MPEIARQQFLYRLQNNWQGYASRFYRLSLPDQKTFLEKQGYANLAGLLGHVIAWWQSGVEAIQIARNDPAYVSPDYDVDLFNAQAVERFGGMDEPEVVRIYEAQRRVLFDLVNDLSDAELENPGINRRLYYEIIMHWDEHPLA